jgi:outer membrane protein assembly factor BamB
MNPKTSQAANRFITGLACCALLTAATVWGADPTTVAAQPGATAAQHGVPLGHQDFYPSPDCPVGEFGDGTAQYPGAKDVALEWDHRTGKNIVWKCRMPSWSNSSAIVVGKKIFVGSEPDELICVDTDSGKILWKTSVMIDQFIPETDRAAVRTALAQINDQVMALDIPAENAGQWVEAIAPVVEPAVSETAQRIAEIRKKVAATGTLAGGRPKLPAGLIVSKASYDMLKKHQIQRSDRRGPEKDPYIDSVIGWQAHMGFTMPTPVSDGKNVWYKSALGAIACLDLDGKMIWSKRIRTHGGVVMDVGSHFMGCGSPLLIDDRLFYTVDGQRDVYAVDKNSGEELWHQEHRSSTGEQREPLIDTQVIRGGGSISHLRLGKRDFISVPGLGLLEATTGQRIQYEYPVKVGCVGRRNAVFGDTIVYVGEHMMGSARLQLKSDTITAESLWARCTGGSWCCYPVIHDGYVFYAQATTNPNIIIAYRPLGPGNFEERRPGGPPLFVPDPKKGARTWGDKKNRLAQWVYSGCAYADGHLFVGCDSQGMTVAKLAGPESVIVSRNVMDLGIRSAAFFQGNRMYIRSYHYLYCIGNNGASSLLSPTKQP